MNTLTCMIILLASANLASAQSTVLDTVMKPDKSEPAYYYMDGIKVRGSSHLPMAAIGEVTVVTGGLPVVYSNVNSSVVCIDNGVGSFSPKKETRNIDLAPNPASESVNISLADETFIGGRVLLCSSLGKVLQIARMDEIRTLMDVSELPAGMYIVFIEKNGKTLVETLAIE